MSRACTAHVEDDMPPCGEPATTERDGSPRCDEHAFEDDAAYFAGEDYRAYLREVAR